MKKQYKKICTGILLVLMTHLSFAQWQTNGPYGGPINNVITNAGGNLFAGTSNGVVMSTDDGANWTAANTGIERLDISALTAYGTTLFAGTAANGVFFSSDNGVSWVSRNTGITTMFITSLFAADSGMYAGTPDGVFATFDNGLTWTLRNAGISSTYEIYGFAQMGDTIFGGTYGVGLYQTYDNGLTWNPSTTGIPGSTFVYALASDGNTLYAGTSGGVYISTDRGASWLSSNTGFPPSMWAKSFAIKPGFIFAGTYSEGIFVSSNGGATWAPMNSGIPDLPFPTGLPHNYPSVDGLTISGSSVIAATVNGIYRSTNDGTSWTESNQGIVSNDVFALAVNNSAVFAGSARTGVYASSDKGLTWARKNMGLTAYDVLALATNATSVFVSVSNQKVFRSDDNGNTWISTSNGIPSGVFYLEADNNRVLALTTGFVGITAGLFQTIDNGVNWTQIPTPFVPASSMSTVTLVGPAIYVGTWDGKVQFTNTNGASWSDISTGLPSGIKITRILFTSGVLFAATDGSGVYHSTDSGASWSLFSSGLANPNVNDLVIQGSTLYAGTWGGGVFVSGNMGSSWTPYNTDLSNLYVRKLAVESTKIYAATDAGVFVSALAVVSVPDYETADVQVYPNPGTGLLYVQMPPNQKVKIKINNTIGATIYTYEGYSGSIDNIDLSSKAKGVYLLELQTETSFVKKKIIIQ